MRYQSRILILTWLGYGFFQSGTAFADTQKQNEIVAPREHIVSQNRTYLISIDTSEQRRVFELAQNTATPETNAKQPSRQLTPMSAELKRLIEIYQRSLDETIELSTKGVKISLRSAFKRKMHEFSGYKQGQFRLLGMEAYKHARQDSSLYGLSALLLENADNLLARVWIDEKDIAERLRLRQASEKIHRSTLPWKGFAAFKAADSLSYLQKDNKVLGPSFSFHSIAAQAGVQRSRLAMGYLLRRYRIQNPNAKEGSWALSNEEQRHFSQAMECDDANVAGNPFPYEQALCDLAQMELNAALITEQRRMYAGPDALSGVIMGLVGLVALGAAISNGSPSGPVSIQPLQGPSELETFAWEYPGG